ncbi:hypothetical protein GALL_170860 [mine drainage metagenome]|uniref:Uncharacterized protein n=1 Tax=mine drainage metagenome TaxID=410659 RepID=A0A1J5S952_9ZZZZ
MTAPPLFPAEARRVLWSQFILAGTLAVVARRGSGAFAYTDTHAGSGRLPGAPALLAPLLAAGGDFQGQAFFQALQGQAPAFHPGSWVLAGRVLTAAGREPEIDVNDIDAAALAAARAHREGLWTRFWRHDWFSFLRSRLDLAHPPQFVFIDPPPDDARGPAYAIDAAILLDTLKIPYMVSYPALEAQESIDQIGRTGLELLAGAAPAGVLLGGGAEQALLELLPDLRRLAPLLGGRFQPRLPQAFAYMI